MNYRDQYLNTNLGLINLSTLKINNQCLSLSQIDRIITYFNNKNKTMNIFPDILKLLEVTENDKK